MAPIGLKMPASARGWPAFRLHENAILPRLFLTFRACGGFNRRQFSERRSFRPAARPWRPEVNARQRDAPSGANVFGLSVIGDGSRASPASAGEDRGLRASLLAGPFADRRWRFACSSRAGQTGRRTGRVRQSVGKAWWHSRSADAARVAVGGRRRCRDARGAPRAARGRRLARRRQELHRARPRAGDRRHRGQVGDARPDGGEDRP